LVKINYTIALKKNFSPLDEIAVGIIKYKVIAVSYQLSNSTLKNCVCSIKVKSYPEKLKVQGTALAKREHSYRECLFG